MMKPAVMSFLALARECGTNNLPFPTGETTRASQQIQQQKNAEQNTDGRLVR